MTQQYSLRWNYYLCVYNNVGGIYITSFLFDSYISGDAPSTFQFNDTFTGECGDNSTIANAYFIDSDPANSYAVNITQVAEVVGTDNASTTPSINVNNQTMNELTVSIPDPSGVPSQSTIAAGGTATYDIYQTLYG